MELTTIIGLSLAVAIVLEFIAFSPIIFRSTRFETKAKPLAKDLKRAA